MDVHIALAAYRVSLMWRRAFSWELFRLNMFETIDTSNAMKMAPQNANKIVTILPGIVPGDMSP